MGIDDGFFVATPDADWTNRLLVENRKLKAVRNQEARRERIATAAMQGLLAGDTPDGDDLRSFPRFDSESPADIADYAVNFADALIAKLDEGE